MSKNSGFSFAPEIITDPGELRQTIYKQSVDQNHAIGAQFREKRGGQTKLYRYVKVGASNISKGQLQQAPAPIANHNNSALGGTAAKGDREITVVTSMTTALTDEEYRDGVLHVNDADAEGSFYTIKEHTNSATPVITLHDPLAEALAATSEITLTKNEYNGIIVAPTTLTALLVGVTVIDLTAGYYGWIQTGGDVSCLTEGTLVIGQPVGYPGTITVPGSCGVPAITDTIVGSVRAVNATTEYSLIKLTNLDH